MNPLDRFGIGHLTSVLKLSKKFELSNKKLEEYTFLPENKNNRQEAINKTKNMGLSFNQLNKNLLKNSQNKLKEKLVQ